MLCETLREKLDNLRDCSFPPVPGVEREQDLLLVSAEGRRLFGACVKWLYKEWCRDARGDFFSNRVGFGVGKQVNYLGDLTTIEIVSRGGRDGRGISIALARPCDSYVDNNRWGILTSFAEYLFDRKQEALKRSTPFLVVYEGPIGHPELWRAVSSNLPYGGTEYRLLRRARLPELRLFAEAVTALHIFEASLQSNHKIE